MIDALECPGIQQGAVLELAERAWHGPIQRRNISQSLMAEP